MKKRGIEIGMAVLMLVCFYILSREAAEATEKLKDVSGNIQAGQVILVDAGHGGIDSGMVGIEGLKEKGINLEYLIFSVHPTLSHHPTECQAHPHPPCV